MPPNFCFGCPGVGPAPFHDCLTGLEVKSLRGFLEEDLVEDMEVNKEDMTEGLQEEEEEERMQALRLGKEERRAKEAQLSHQQQVGQQKYVHCTMYAHSELVMGSDFISISKLPKNLPHHFISRLQ